MGTHNRCFCAEIRKLICGYPLKWRYESITTNFIPPQGGCCRDTCSTRFHISLGYLEHYLQAGKVHVIFHSPRRVMESSSNTLYHIEGISFNPPVKCCHVIKYP